MKNEYDAVATLGAFAPMRRIRKGVIGGGARAQAAFCKQRKGTDMVELDELETSLAKAAGNLVQTVLQIARSQTPASAGFLDGLTAATLAVNVTGTRIHVELRTRVEVLVSCCAKATVGGMEISEWSETDTPCPTHSQTAAGLEVIR